MKICVIASSYRVFIEYCTKHKLNPMETIYLIPTKQRISGSILKESKLEIHMVNIYTWEAGIYDLVKTYATIPGSELREAFI